MESTRCHTAVTHWQCTVHENPEGLKIPYGRSPNPEIIPIPAVSRFFQVAALLVHPTGTQPKSRRQNASCFCDPPPPLLFSLSHDSSRTHTLMSSRQLYHNAMSLVSPTSPISYLRAPDMVMSSSQTSFGEKSSLKLDIERALSTPLNTELPLISPLTRDAYDTEGVKRLLWKLDTRMIPILALLFLVSLIDRWVVAIRSSTGMEQRTTLRGRVAIGNVKILGLQDDLGLSPQQYTNCLAIYTVFYIVAEVPSNLMLKRCTPKVWLAVLTFLWGVGTMAMVRGSPLFPIAIRRWKSGGSTHRGSHNRMRACWSPERSSA